MASLKDNAYLRGDLHAVLTKEEIFADWGKGPGSGTRIDATNRAFCIWYHGQWSLWEQYDTPHYSEMKEVMDACVKTGWGGGVSDLRESFWHYQKTGGFWTDDNVKTYYGGKGKCYNRAILSDMPEGPANFLKAVDDKLPKLRKALEAFRDSSNALASLKGRKDPKDLERMDKHLGEIKKWAGRAQSMAWMLPGTVTMRMPNTKSSWDAWQRVEEFADGGVKWIKRTTKIIDVFGKISDGVKVYASATAALGGDRKAGLAFAGMHYAVSHVPILGAFYGAIIAKIPELVTNWKDFMTDYTRRLDDPEGWLKQQSKKKAPWACKDCRSSGGY